MIRAASFRRLPSLARLLGPACLVLLAAWFVLLVVRFHHPLYGFTSFLQLDASNEETMLPELRDRPVFIYRDTGGYDGLYYAQLACRPTLRDPALATALDNFPYRARRMLASWAAWALALGDPVRALDAYALLNPLCWFALGALLLAVFPPCSLHGVLAWAGLMFSAGVLASVRFALTDLPALLLVVAGVAAWERGRQKGAVAWFAAAALARETSLLAVLGLNGVPWRRRVVLAFAAALPLAGWIIYVRLVAGPSDAGWGNFAWPGLGFVEKWRAAWRDLGDARHAALMLTTVLTLLGITVQAGWIMARPDWGNLRWRLGAVFTGLMFCLGTAPWEGQPGAAARVLLPLHFAFNTLVPRTRAGLVLLIAGNLGAFSGILAMSDPPHPAGELAVARLGDTIVTAQAGTGWHQPERQSGRVWGWASGPAEVVLQIHAPAGTATPRISLSLSGFTPRTLTVLQGGRILWTGRVERKARWAELSGLEFSNSRATIMLEADATAELENDSPTARRLSHGIKGLRVDP